MKASANDRVGIIVATPTRAGLSRETAYALRYHFDGYEKRAFKVIGKPVDEARNELVRRIQDARRTLSNDKEWFVLWTDDDAWWQAGTIKQLTSLARSHPNVSLFVAYHSTRSANSGTTAVVDPAARGSTFRLCSDHNCGLLKIISSGGHMWFHRLSLFDALPDRPFEVLPGNYEDHSFCRRVREAGGTIALATSVPVAHIDVSKGLAFLPYAPPHKIERGRIRAALDSEVMGLNVDSPSAHAYGDAIEPARAEEIATQSHLLQLHERLEHMAAMSALVTGKRPPYEMIAQAVRERVGSEKFDAFAAGLEFESALRELGTSGNA